MIKTNDKGKILVDSKTGLNVLFVCTGNTCRSPMCAALFNSVYGCEMVRADSAGLFADGSPVSKNAVEALKDSGITLSPAQKSRMVTEEDVKKADIVVCVTRSHSINLINRFPQYADKIGYMPYEITDPFGGDLDVYKRCLEDIKKSMGSIFEAAADGEQTE